MYPLILYIRSNDSTSMTSETSGDFRPRMDSYQEKFGKKKKEEPEESVKPTSYHPVGGVMSYENPLYETYHDQSEASTLPGATEEADDTYVDVNEVKEDLSAVI